MLMSGWFNVAWFDIYHTKQQTKFDACVANATQMKGDFFMNNKILARVMACVMAVAMLGTVAFADAVTGDKEVLKPGSYIDGQSVNTLLAFAANSETADINYAVENPDKILAIAQGAADTSILIDSTKIAEDDTHVIVLYGGKEATNAAASVAIPLTLVDVELDKEEEFLTSITLDSATFGTEVEYTDLIAATYTFTPAEINNYRVLGAKFTRTPKTGGTAESVTITEDIPTVFSGEGDVTLTVGLTGVPTDDQTAYDFAAVPVYQQYQ